MIRKLLLIPVLAGSLSLAACDPSDLDPTQSGSIASQVQAATRSICGFVPTATTIANVIATFTGGEGVVAIVSQAAQGICGAVTSAPKSVRLKSGKRAKLAIYRGVAVHGSFVR